MPPSKKIEIIYMYLKQCKWKTKTKYINEEDLILYENNNEYKVLSKR
jgi:predicted Rdx family selenoprotein